AQVSANTGSTAGIYGTYLLQADVGDGTAPAGTTTTLPNLPTVATAIDRFTVTFTEDLLPAAANNPANYRLAEAGPDGAFGTGDDVNYAVTPTYGGLTSRTVSFTINPNPLQP